MLPARLGSTAADQNTQGVGKMQINGGVEGTLHTRHSRLRWVRKSCLARVTVRAAAPQGCAGGSVFN